MPRTLCDASELVVRAICSPNHFDPEAQRISPNLFTGSEISLSRLKLLTLEEHWSLFRQHVQKPHQRLELFGEIAVGPLQEIGLNYKAGPIDKPVPQPVTITVEEAPEDWNPAHAEIPQKLTRGLANQIIPALRLHKSA